MIRFLFLLAFSALCACVPRQQLRALDAEVARCAERFHALAAASATEAELDRAELDCHASLDRIGAR